ncbi:S41 family peptidase [Chloroflexi bacterium TSY]|nr:S41 family peptidase [Chloroflexi bacterium TSY]
MNEALKAYLKEALQIIEEHAYFQARVDWVKTTEKAFQASSTASTTSDLYPLIRSILTELKDSHSSLSPPDRELAIRAGDSEIQLPHGSRIENDFGYINVPRFTGNDIQAVLYASTLQSEIRRLDSKTTRGWIVDLCQNKGGNMWPMLAGIGPLLGDGVVGMFVDMKGRQTCWSYENGQALYDNEVVYELDHPIQLFHRLPPVALLTGSDTASSGEAIAVAFRKRPKSASFGQLTAGLSTANDAYALADGAVLYLPVALFADREGEVYGGPLEPDYPSDSSETALSDAVEWLRTQSS